ncbi:MAG: hypothetical protein KIT24_06385 [Phycisphaeraceae bacterium]|nr:hypothetical protein [Phycisphaeraceae bacterium]
MSSPVVVTPRGAAPLWTVLAIALLSSIGTAFVQQGVFVLLKARYDASPAITFGVATVFGVMYLAAALGIGPALSRINRRSKRITTRLILNWVLVLMGLTCMIPWITQTAFSSTHIGWWWITIAVYAPLTGIHWPVVESYLSGGRTESGLLRATGRFNIVWGASMLLAYLFMTPFVQSYQVEVLALAGGVHLATLFVVAKMPSDPAEHAEHTRIAPESYRRQLAVFRILLPASYLVQGSLMPFLPSAVKRLDIPTEFWAVVIATWYAARVVVFAAFGRWHGWHGRWATPICGAVLMLTGFALCLLAPGIDDHAGASVGRWLLVIGLIPFGAGMGVIYSGAIYYALEVGQAEVHAGGTHESLIGLGMTLGPACGLGIAAASQYGWIAPGAADSILLALTLTAGVIFGGFAIASSLRQARAARLSGSELPPPV